MNRWWGHVRIDCRHLVAREIRAKTIGSDGRAMKIIGVPSRKIDNFVPELIETNTPFRVSSVQAASRSVPLNALMARPTYILGAFAIPPTVLYASQSFSAIFSIQSTRC
jgi:hypothetical protein